MRKSILCFSVILSAAASLPLLLIAQQTSTTSQPAEQNKPAKKMAHQPAQPQSEGERVFAQNCSRCHTAPDGFSPRISGTVAMHMRVRAALSAHDEQELMRFLNP
jgi:cytochrome c5